jgi:F-type H+-transporting ATPase subunit b
MFNEKFWLAIAFTSFVLLIAKYVWPKIAASLDLKSKQIAADISAAKEMKEKAQKLLEDLEKYHAESEKFAKKLLEDAESEAQKFVIEAKKSVEAEIEKKTNAALERVKVEEASAIREVKLHVVSSALKILNESLNKKMEKKHHDLLLNQATDDLSKLIH